MADQTPDLTAWSDEQLDSLLDVRGELEQLRERVETLETTVADEQGREWSVPKLVSEFGLSRRQALIAAGFVAAGMGLFPALARAIGENESYGSSSGVVGTDSTPLQEVNSKRGHFQSVQTEQLRVSESGVRASLRSSQSISSGLFVKVPYDNTLSDDAGEFDAATGTFSPSGPGRYLITASVQLSGFSNGSSKAVRVLVNGSPVAFRSESQNTDFSTIELSAMLRLASGVSVTVEIRQASGGTATVEPSDTATTLAIAQIA